MVVKRHLGSTRRYHGAALPSRSAPLTLERLDAGDCDWEAMDGLEDRVVFQTREWLEYLAATQGAEPVICRVARRDEAVGYFTGAIVRRYGIRILGSPFPGWTTAYMGFNLREGESRREAVRALMSYAFGPLRCLHLELRDRELDEADARSLGATVDRFYSFEIDLRATEDELLARMSSACRRCIRKAERSGVTVEPASDMGFADDYHAQLEDVFAKQGLRPTYGVERVRALMEHLLPAGRLLALRARAPDGRCVATALYPALGRSMHFWGGASWRGDQILRPNEAIFWYAMRYWKSRGVETFDMGGGGEYKRKYGGCDLTVPHVIRSRVPGLMPLRTVAERFYEVGGLRRAIGS